MDYYLTKMEDKLYITQYGSSVGTGIILHLDTVDTEFLQDLKNICLQELENRKTT